MLEGAQALVHGRKMAHLFIVAVDDTRLMTSRVFYVMEKLAGYHFQVDTGAEESVLLTSHQYCRSLWTSPLQVADGSCMATYGPRLLTINIDLRRTFQWTFNIVDVDITAYTIHSCANCPNGIHEMHTKSKKTYCNVGRTANSKSVPRLLCK